ncbi:MAG TPA: hypothetical protein VM840_02420 [Actinomycetota bacterium]|nr:hypothetical protein [Actinomycetota bacterium]
MNVTLNGVISVSVEDEWLFDGQPLPVSFVCDLSEDTVRFEDGKVKMSFSVPVELAISEEEWSRAVGEVLARAVYTGSPGDAPSP